MPDSNELETLQARIATAQAQITTAARFACRHYHHGAPPEEVEEFTEQIIALLLDDNCRRLQTYDPSQSSFKTWLQHIVNHHVSHQLQKNHPTESLEEELLDTLSDAPTQEEELLRKEQRAILYAAIDKLSLHDQRLARLKLREVPDDEIARELNIKPASVGREWRVIKAKLVQIGKVGAQCNAMQCIVVTPHENFCNIFYFGIRFLIWQVYKEKKSVHSRSQIMPIIEVPIYWQSLRN